MKIRIAMDIDLDPYDWAEEYGILLADVPEDVRYYVGNLLNEHLVSHLKVVRNVERV